MNLSYLLASSGSRSLASKSSSASVASTSAGPNRAHTAALPMYTPFPAHDSTSTAHITTSVQGGPVLPGISEIYTQNNAEHHPVPTAKWTEHNSIQMAHFGQGDSQIMAIENKQGYSVQIPVDVTTASGRANDKRKRNASASARFRAKRKEREREASVIKACLEQQLREALEDVEHYRDERDYFRCIVFQLPNAKHHYVRPPSPRHERSSSAPSNAPSSDTGAGSTGSPYSGYNGGQESFNSPGQITGSVVSAFPSVKVPPPQPLNLWQQRRIPELHYAKPYLP